MQEAKLWNASFVNSHVLPAALVLVLPTLSLLFFLHAQQTFNGYAREALIHQVEADQELSPSERAEAKEFYTRVPFSRLLREPEYAASVPSDTRWHFATFRSMIWLSAGSLIATVVALLLTLAGVWVSMRSQRLLYHSMRFGWHVLQVYSVAQCVAQAVMLVALSFWVTALWFDFYSVKIIAIAGVIAGAGVIAMLVSFIWIAPPKFEVAGKPVSREDAPQMWDSLDRICDQVGTDPPDNVLLGIDDSFFVTESPVTTAEMTFTGRTLFASLALLRHLTADEADAIVAHEMAHFSGGDTTFGTKISPLLQRFHHHLQKMYDGVITKPVFYFMLLFRNLYELALGKHSRTREFRADAIASGVVGAEPLAAALLRTTGYSTYRQEVEQRLFAQETEISDARIGRKISEGFPAHLAAFLSGERPEELTTSHPFDTHPPIQQRLEAIGCPAVPEGLASLVDSQPPGAWRDRVPIADELEQSQWDEYEENFRKFHREVLAYRYLPANAQEAALVAEYFPAVQFESKRGVLRIDHDGMTYDKWDAPQPFGGVKSMALNDSTLTISTASPRKGSLALNLAKFVDKPDTVLTAIQNYYGRHLAARDYQQSLEEGANAPE